jgi:hypothetical protein
VGGRQLKREQGAGGTAYITWYRTGNGVLILYHTV